MEWQFHLYVSKSCNIWFLYWFLYEKSLFSIHGLPLEPQFSHKLLHEQISTNNNDLLLMYSKVSPVETVASTSIFCNIFAASILPWLVSITAFSHVFRHCSEFANPLHCIRLSLKLTFVMFQRFQTSDVFLIKTNDMLLMLFVVSSF